MTRLTEKRFNRDFIPTIINVDPNAEAHSGFGGCLYAIHGKDEEYIRNYPDQKRIWTLLDCDGKLYIAAGWHYVNRMGYFITKHPWDKEDYEVRIR